MTKSFELNSASPQLFNKYFCHNVANIRGIIITYQFPNKFPILTITLNKHGGVRGEARFPPPHLKVLCLNGFKYAEQEEKCVCKWDYNPASG